MFTKKPLNLFEWFYFVISIFTKKYVAAYSNDMVIIG